MSVRSIVSSLVFVLCALASFGQPASPAPATDSVASERAADTPASPPPDFGLDCLLEEAPSTEALSGLKIFDEPLSPVRPPADEENRALARALADYLARPEPRRTDELLAFARADSRSAWAPSLMLQLGRILYLQGRYTVATELFRAAHDAARAGRGPGARAIADLAAGHHAKMLARVGRRDELRAFLALLPSTPPVDGNAVELLTQAREGLWSMCLRPEVSFRCGPMALASIAQSRPDATVDLAPVHRSRSTPEGFSLAEVARLSDEIGLPMRAVRRAPGSAWVVPAVVHWKLGHYAAIIGRAEDDFLVSDPTFGDGRRVRMSAAALEEECSGFLLVPAEAALPDGWFPASAADADRVRGRGQPGIGDPRRTTPCDKQQGGCTTSCQAGMAGYTFHSMLASLTVRDTPLQHRPPYGDAVDMTLTYNEREAGHPSTYGFSNFSPRWSFGWMSWVYDTTDGVDAPDDVELALPGGGSSVFRIPSVHILTQREIGPGYIRDTHFVSGSSGRHRESRAVLSVSGTVVVDVNTGVTLSSERSYLLTYPDGRSFEYARYANAAAPRRILLTKRLDPQGNATTLNYDASNRITSLVDAAGRSLTFAYTVSGKPSLVSKITDPYGRFASFGYDANGMLASSTDTVGIVSRFLYQAGSPQRISGIMTPYGATDFAYGEAGADPSNALNWRRWIEATDALGAKERIETVNDTRTNPALSAGDSFPTSELPDMRVDNTHVNLANTFYWDKRAYAASPGLSAGQSPGAADYAKATITHWLWEQNGGYTSGLPEWTWTPGESRVYYNYQRASPSTAFEEHSDYVPDGTVRHAPLETESAQLSVIGRLVPDPEGGSTPVSQLDRFAYNAQGKLTRHRDPAGRETLYTYASNGIDLLRVDRVLTRGATPLPDNWTIGSLPSGWTTVRLAAFTYDTTHPRLVATATDEAGTVTSYTYNAKGQLKTVTDGRGTTTLWYSTNGTPGGASSGAAGFLARIDGPLSGTQDQTTLTWANGAVETITDESGFTATYTRDAWLRPTAISYTDGSTETFSYQEEPHPASPPDEIPFPSAPLPGLEDLRRYSLASWKGRDGHTQHYRYDALNRLLEIRDETGARVLGQQWCECGSLESFTDRKGQTTSFLYDEQGRLTDRIYPAVAGEPANQLGYTYDLAGRLQTLTNARGQVTTYRHTVDDRLRAILHPTGLAVPTASTFYTYDNVHPRLTRAENRAGPDPLAALESAVDYLYHPITGGVSLGAGRLASVTTTLGAFTTTRSYTYDAYGRRVNRVAAGTGSGATATLGYDGANRVVSHTNPLGAFTLGYDGGSARLASIARSGGLTAAYGYLPPANRLRSIDWTLTGTTSLVSGHRLEYSADPARTDDRILAWTLLSAGGATNTWLFDYAERPEAELVSAVQENAPAGLSDLYAYSYDQAGNRESEQRGSAVQTTDHNARNQAAQTSAGGPFLVRARLAPEPAAGPWLNDTTTMQPEEEDKGAFAAPLQANVYRAEFEVTPGENVFRLEAVDGAGGRLVRHYPVNVPAPAPRSYDYDEDGNLVSITEGTPGNFTTPRTYTWDARNRLVSWGGASTTPGSFVYDPEGHRIAEKNGAGVIQRYWTWDGPELLAEHDASGAVTVRYFGEGYQRVAGANTGSYYYTRDHLGSIREVVNASNTIVAAYAYDPFGRRVKTSGTENADLGYTGHYHHAATGLWLTHFRAYDADLGRWLSRDPIGPLGPDGPNLYNYVRNSPVNFVDPDGRFAWFAIPLLFIATTEWLNAPGPEDQIYSGLADDVGPPIPNIPQTAKGLAKLGAKKAAKACKPSSPGKMQKEVERGQAPRDVERVDRGHVPNQEPHVHYRDGTSSTTTGRTHDAHRGTPNPSGGTRDWLEGHGWTPPPQ